ncbi:MAG: RES family NAD+ phosphorylase [Sphaerochaeta sp.]
MNCCSECFYDEEIIAIIKGEKLRGNCDICGKKNVNICDINHEAIQTNFKSLIDVYVPILNTGDLDNNFLKDVLLDRWNIFNLKPNQVQTFLISLFPEDYKSNKALFENHVKVNPIIFDEYSMFGESNWNNFAKEIKEINRFHTQIIKLDFLQKIINYHAFTIPKLTKLYRGRILNSKTSYSKSEMGAPPKGKAKAGRINPDGISCLYLSDTIETTFYEIRAGLNDKAIVADFILKEEVTVVDLTGIDAISPFTWINSEAAIEDLASNIQHLKTIASEIARPLCKSDKVLDYLPIQYICDYIKSENFDGIKYKSTLHEDGINYAFFDENLFDCNNIETYEISSLKYKYDKSKKKG